MVDACRDKAHDAVPVCAVQLERILHSPDTAKSATGPVSMPIFPVAPLPFARYTSRLRYGCVFYCPYYLVVQLPPPNRRWEWRKNELGPSRSQGWHDAYLHGRG